MRFQRQPLREAIQKEILTRIVSGSLPAGCRINETHLAEDLGLSRTPLREAMLTLVATGHLASDMGKGFAVPPLDPRQLLDITEMLSQLQPLALGQIMPLEPTRLMELSNILSRTRVKLSKDPHRQNAGQNTATLVYNWNEILLPEGPNALLISDIKRLESLASRFWFAAGNLGLDSSHLLDSYTGLYELIRQGQKDRACQVWTHHIARFGQDARRCLS